MSDGPVRVGVIGCGVIGRRHMDAISGDPKRTRLTAVADLRRDVAEECGQTYGTESVYGDAASLLDDPAVEAVVLALPTAGRAPWALDALARGRHVLLEKPGAMNADEMRRMIDARGDRVAACCSSRMRFLRCARVVEDAIAAGEIGELRSVRSRGTFPIGPAPDRPPPAWRLSRALNGGGLLVNWGCYDLDFILGVTRWRLRPQTVFARTWTLAPQFHAYAAPDSDGETHFVALIGCEDGVAISLERAELAPLHGDTVCEFIGTRGSLRLKMVTDVDNEVVLYTADGDRGTTQRSLWSGKETDMAHHRGPVANFADAIRGRAEPKTSLDHALTIQRLLDAIDESARANAAVTLA